MNKLNSIILLLSIFLPISVLAGNEGGGGIGVKCGEKVSVLDLFEAEYIYNRTITRRYLDLETNIKEFGFIAASYESESSNQWTKDTIYQIYQSEIINRIVDLKKGESLELSSDATLPTIPSNCEFVQIAFYNDLENKIYRDRSLWDKLSVQDKAALLIHEGHYKVKRNSRIYNSDTTRFIVGMVISNELPEPMWKPIEGKVKVECGSRNEGKYHFIAVEETRKGTKGLGLYFSLINDEYKMERVSGFIKNADRYSLFYDLNKLKTIELYGEIFKQITNIELKTSYDGEYGVDIKLSGDLEKSWISCELRN
jgi:hypothetical protein